MLNLSKTIMKLTMKLTEEDFNLLSSLGDNFDEAIIGRDLKGNITCFNKGAEFLYGYTKEEAMGMSLLNITPEEYKEEFNDILNKVKNGNKIENHETLRYKKNSEAITALISVYPIICDEKIIGSIEFSRDIIEKEVYKLAIEGGNFEAWDWNIKTNMVYFTGRYKEMLGYDDNKISYNHDEWIKRIHKEDVDFVMDQLKRHFEGEEFIVKYRIKCKNGNYIWVRTKGKVIQWDKERNPLRMAGTNEDINKEMLLKRKIDEEENRLIAIYRTVNAGIAHGKIIQDSFGNIIDYKFLHINRYMEEIIGVKFENFSIQNIINLFGKNQEDWFFVLNQVSLSRKSYRFEYYNEAGDKYYNINIYSPNPMQFVLYVTDITELKKKEIDLTEKYEELQSVYEELTATEEELKTNYEELEKANEKAERANKAKTQFLANMSHELRTPLNGILGCTQLLKFSKLSEEQNENLIMIEKSSQHLLGLINDILDLSKIEVGKIELSCKRFDFMELMEFVIKDLNLLSIGKDIEIMYYIDPSINRELIGDSFRLKQILNNLISNAVKFTEQGHVYLKVRQISKTMDETKLQFIIEDTGKGIKEEFNSEIFNSFTQEESNYAKSYGGTGLGLAISKELVKMMGGDIGFDSKVNKGSTFYFTAVFKNVTNDTYAIDSINNICFIQKTAHKNVLVVEDNEINLKIVTSFLKQLNYKYYFVHNGQEAIDYLDKNKADIILMDIQMPVLNGLDAAKIIRDRESKTKEHKIIIAMTAYAMNSDRKKFIDCGMDDYISKPFDIETLGEILGKF